MKAESAQALIVRAHREAGTSQECGERITEGLALAASLGGAEWHLVAAELAAHFVPDLLMLFRMREQPLSAALRRDARDQRRFQMRVAERIGRAAKAWLKDERHRLGPEFALIARLSWEALLAMPEVRVCRLCGCCDAWGCAGGCSWAEPDLCDRCQPVLPLEGVE